MTSIGLAGRMRRSDFPLVIVDAAAERNVIEQKATMIVDHISYSRIEERYDSDIFTLDKGGKVRYHEVTDYQTLWRGVRRVSGSTNGDIPNSSTDKGRVSVGKRVGEEVADVSSPPVGEIPSR